MNANRFLKRKYRLIRTERTIAAELRAERINPMAILLISQCGHGYAANRTGSTIERYLWVLEEMRNLKMAEYRQVQLKRLAKAARKGAK